MSYQGKGGSAIMKDEYYEPRAWDQGTRIPNRAKLTELALEDVAGEVWGRKD